MPTIKHLRKTLGWTEDRSDPGFVRTTKQLVARLEEEMARAEPEPEAVSPSPEPDPPPSASATVTDPPPDPEGARYDLTVEWDPEQTYIGVDRLKRKSFYTQGTISAHRLGQCYLAQKIRPRRYAFTFSPDEVVGDIPVFVNGEEVGESGIAYTPGSEWGSDEQVINTIAVSLPDDSEWVRRLARSLGRSLD